MKDLGFNRLQYVDELSLHEEDVKVCLKEREGKLPYPSTFSVERLTARLLYGLVREF